MANTQLAVNMLLVLLIMVTVFFLVMNNSAYITTTFLGASVFLYDTVRAKQTPGMALNTIVGSPNASRIQKLLMANKLANPQTVCMPGGGVCVRIDEKSENLQVSIDSSTFEPCAGLFLDNAELVVISNSVFWSVGTSLGLRELRYSNDGQTWFTF
jgi:hypothetical protein